MGSGFNAKIMSVAAQGKGRQENGKKSLLLKIKEQNNKKIGQY